MTMRARADKPRVVVFAPAPLLTVTVERKGEDPEIHLHAGGQGFWVARMVAALGVPVTLCGSFGGEVGAVVRTLMEREGLHVVGIEADVGNAAYVHDRRSGTRDVVAEMQARALSRHEVDELYGVVLIEALEAAVCVVAGSSGPAVVPADTYRRPAADLRANDGLVIADLAGDARRAVLAGGVRALKVSHEELLADGVVASDSIEELLGGLETLRAAGAADVVIFRADRPAIATCDGAVVEVEGPRRRLRRCSPPGRSGGGTQRHPPGYCQRAPRGDRAPRRPDRGA